MSCSETPLHQHLLFSCSAANQWLSKPNRKPHVKDLHYFKKTKLGFNTTVPLRRPSWHQPNIKNIFFKYNLNFRKLQFCILIGFHVFSYSVCMFKFRILLKLTCIYDRLTCQSQTMSSR